MSFRVRLTREAEADLQSIQESIQGQQGLSVAYESMMVSRRNQFSLLNEELVNTRGLVKDGYVPRNRQLELERLIILEFPDMAMLRAFYGSPEYTPLIALRQACTTSDVTIVDGYLP